MIESVVPVMESWPSFDAEDGALVARVLQSGRVNYWTGGEGRAFEQEFAAWAGATHAIALSNGTVALDAALLACGIGRGDEVVVTPRTFLASVSSIVNAGAKPVFADVDRDSGNITPSSVEPHLGPRTRAIVCVHLGGWMCDMPGFRDLVAGRDIALIEDCAQAHGARLDDRPAGTYGDVAAWSFCQDKIMTTGGEGGMLTTDEERLYRVAWSYKDHGKALRANEPGGAGASFRWLHDGFGTNGRMTEMQAALGRRQLSLMHGWSAARRRNAERLWEAARDCPGLRVPQIPARVHHAAYKCYVHVDPAALADGWDRDRIIMALRERGVPAQSGSCSEVYLEKAFDGLDCRPAKPLPIARELGQTSLMFQVHPTLSARSIEHVAGSLQAVMNEACRGAISSTGPRDGRRASGQETAERASQ